VLARAQRDALLKGARRFGSKRERVIEVIEGLLVFRDVQRDELISNSICGVEAFGLRGSSARY
jgi:hypothetical protein